MFSIAMGADYSFELNSIETLAPTFFGHINLFLGSVQNKTCCKTRFNWSKIRELVVGSGE